MLSCLHLVNVWLVLCLLPFVFTSGHWTRCLQCKLSLQSSQSVLFSSLVLKICCFLILAPIHYENDHVDNSDLEHVEPVLWRRAKKDPSFVYRKLLCWIILSLLHAQWQTHFFMRSDMGKITMRKEDVGLWRRMLTRALEGNLTNHNFFVIHVVVHTSMFCTLVSVLAFNL